MTELSVLAVLLPISATREPHTSTNLIVRPPVLVLRGQNEIKGGLQVTRKHSKELLMKSRWFKGVGTPSLWDLLVATKMVPVLLDFSLCPVAMASSNGKSCLGDLSRDGARPPFEESR